MALADVQGGFEKKGTQLGKATSISAGTPSVEIRDANTEVWPSPKRAVTPFDVRAGGSPMIRAADYIVGRPEPAVTVRAPFSLTVFGWSMLSLLQNASFLTGTYTINPYTESNVGNSTDGDFLVLEAGMGAASVFKMYGVVAQTVNITIPTSGPDGGRPEISTDFIGASVTIADSFTATPSVASDGVSPSTEFSFAMGPSASGTAAYTVVDFNLSLSNGVDRSPNIGTSADAMFLGYLTGSGSVSVLLDAVASGGFDDIMDAYIAGTPWQIEVSNSTLQTDILLDFDVLFMDPSFSVQGNAIVATFPFEVCNYNGNTRPQAIVDLADVSWTGQA